MAETESTSSFPPTTPQGGQGNILIVDDDAKVMTALCRTLADLGYQTQGCTTAVEALALLRKADYDVLLSDLMMPQMDGILLIRAAQEIDPTLMSIVMTGHGAINTAVEAMQNGAFDYIEKPPRLSVLAPLLSRALQVRQLRNENVQLRQAVAMYELSMAVAFSLDADLILRKTADMALQVSQADEVSIVLPTPDGTEGYIAVVGGDNRSHLVGQTVPFTHGVTGWVAQSHEALMLHGSVTDPRFTPTHPHPEIHSALSVPLVTGGRLVGILNVNATKRARTFTRGDLKAVSSLANIAASALVNTQLHKQLQDDIAARMRAEEALRHETQISTALARVGQELITSLDAPTLLDHLCRLTCEVLQCEVSITVLWQEAEYVYTPVAHWGGTLEQWETLQLLKMSRPKFAAILTALEQETIAQMTTTETANLFFAALQQQYETSRCVYIALRRGEEIVGVQIAAFRHATPSLTPQEERIAQGMAQIASFALNNARLFEQSERANRLKSDFLATFSHELRTPLNIIIGYTDLLLEGDFGPLNSEQDNTLRQVGKSADNLFELLSAILDVSRLEQTQLPIKLENVDVPMFLTQLLKEFEPQRQQRPELSFEWRVVPDLPPLSTDRAKLKIILKNLLNNAFKFTDAGGVKLEAFSQENGVAFRVSDTGIGMAPQLVPEIFDMFRQGDSSMTRRHDGIGLGLYIVRQLLKALGGTVTVESEVGRGSIFHVWIPNAELTAAVDRELHLE